MDWREIYARRLCTPEQAAALIAPGDRIFAGGAGSFPAVLIDAVSDRAELRGIPVVTVVNGTESRALSTRPALRARRITPCFSAAPTASFSSAAACTKTPCSFTRPCAQRARSTVSIH